MPEDMTARREAMVARHIAARGIRDPTILAAFREVPREVFVPDNLAEFAYDDGPLPIGEGQTISQPYIVAAMIEAAEIGAGDRVLEVGGGSGYAAAVMSRIAGQVFAIERHKPLADAAELRLARLGYDNVTVIAADGSGGLPDEAPFDAILVAARGPEAPEPLKRQLKVGGRLVIPVGGEIAQKLCAVTRTGEDAWTSDDLGAVRFVPLIGAHGVPENGTRAASDHRAARDKPIAHLVAEAAVPLPELDDPAFAAAVDRFADRRVVMLGEASHGTHEFYAARAAITRRFVERHGGKAMRLDQPAGDRGASAIELGGAMAGLPQQHHAFVGEAVEQRAEGGIVEAGQGLGGLGDQAGRRLARRGRTEAARLGRPLVVAILAPAVLADQRDEGDGAQVVLLEMVGARAGDPDQPLFALSLAHRHDQASAQVELVLQRLRDGWTAGRDQDGVVRGGVGPAMRAVAQVHLGIDQTQPRQALARGPGQGVVALDRVDPGGQPRQHGGGVARARADLQHAILRLDPRRRDHQADDVGLGDRLAGLDRQRGVVIGELAQAFGHEQFARRLAQGLQHALVAHAAPGDLPLDHPFSSVCQVDHGG